MKIAVESDDIDFLSNKDVSELIVNELEDASLAHDKLIWGRVVNVILTIPTLDDHVPNSALT